MESSVEIRPKNKLGFFNRIRNQLMIVFYTIVALVIGIGVVSFYSQTLTQSATEQLLVTDTETIQNVLTLQGEISELRRLEERFIIEVQSPDRIDSAVTNYVEPWRNTYLRLRGQVNNMDMDAMDDMLNSSDAGSVLNLERLDELEQAFEAIIAGHVQRTNLIESTEGMFRIDVWMAQPGFEPMAAFALEQNNRNLRYLQTGDTSYLTQYEAALEEIDGLIAQQGDMLAENQARSFRDRHTDINRALDSLDQLDREINQLREVYRVQLDSIDEVLQRSASQTLSSQAITQEELILQYRAIVLTVIGLLVGAVLIALLYLITSGRQTIQQVSVLAQTIRQIRAGNYRARARVISQDETGYVAGEMNRVLDTTFSLMQTKEEQDAIQDAVMQLMEDVSTVADGDLTVRARGTHALTNDVALSFNETISNLHVIIEQIQETTGNVNHAASQVRNTAQELVESSDAQANYIIDTSAAVDEMAISIQHVSENASVSSQVSETARRNAQVGAVAVEDSIAGIERIRAQVATASDRLTALGDASQNINQSVELINDIADRTSVLALNATIRALAAGEDGRGFTVVAREIESLAAQAAQATQRVSQLSSQMGTDAVQSIESMTRTQQRVENSLVAASSASQRLHDIESVTEQLAEVIREISHAAQQQARSSETVARSMNEIASGTQQTASGTHQTMTSVDSLGAIAQELRDSVALFKLQKDNIDFNFDYDDSIELEG